MSLLAIGMNLLLAALLIAAMVVGLRLNKRLKALRDSHAGFEAAVRELNHAAMRAEQGLADLRAATDEATDLLSDRIEKGRQLAAKLERLVASAPELPRAVAPERASDRPAGRMPPVSPPPRTPASATEDRLGALLAMARSRLAEKEAAQASAAAPSRTPSPIASPMSSYAEAEEPRVGRAPLPGRRISAGLDDDLFEDAPSALDRLTAGARR